MRYNINGIALAMAALTHIEDVLITCPKGKYHTAQLYIT